MPNRNGENTYWRYQPVFEEDENGDKLYSIIEVYMKDDKLDSWTEPTRPAGESLEELLSILQLCHKDCSAYLPVAFDELEVGMEFKPSV